MSINQKIELLLNHSDAEQRRIASEEILEMPSFSSDMLAAMVKGLSDEDRGVRDILTRGLINLPDTAKAEAAEKVAELITLNDIELRNTAGDILAKLGKPSVDPLIPYLESDDQDVRKFACDILGLIADESIVDKVIPLLDDEDQNVVTSAIETFGNLGAVSSLPYLFKLYDKNEDYMPSIIDSLGKIGGAEAQDFLIEHLQDSDAFIQIAIIDALALCGDDVSICHRLMDQLPSAPKEIQLILLKTIFAIAFRLGVNIEMPEDMRTIAYSALMDDDPDIRAAGLISLGSEYVIDDVHGLSNEFMRSDSDTQEYILSNVLLNSDYEVKEAFLNNVLKNILENGMVGSDIDFITVLGNVWDSGNVNDEGKVLTLLVSQTVSTLRSNPSVIIDMLRKLDEEKIDECLLNMLNNSTKEDKLIILDIIATLDMKHLKDNLLEYASKGLELSEDAKKIAENL